MKICPEVSTCSTDIRMDPYALVFQENPLKGKYITILGYNVMFVKVYDVEPKWW